MSKKPRIVDVARMAGVSTATVSYILNQTPGHSFSDDTVQRVQAAAARLQYTIGENRRRGHSEVKNRICIAYSAYSHRFFFPVQGILDELSQHPYQVIQMRMDTDEDIDTELAQPNLDDLAGIICLSTAGMELQQNWSSVIVERQIPCVTADAYWSRNISSVELDYFTGAYDMANDLLASGEITKLFYLHYPHAEEQNPQSVERMHGIRRAAFERQAMLQCIDDPLLPNGTVTGNQYELICRALETLDAQSAVILEWADHNQHVLRMCMERGLPCPIAALESGLLNREVFPQLRYSALPLYDLGVASAQALLRLLKDPSDISHTLLKPTLETKAK